MDKITELLCKDIISLESFNNFRLLFGDMSLSFSDILALLGASAWLPYIIEILQKPKVFCVINEYYWSQNFTYHSAIPFKIEQRITNGSLFILKTNIICVKKDLLIKELNVEIKFQSVDSVQKGELIFLDEISTKQSTFENAVNEVFKFNNNILSRRVIQKDIPTDIDIPIYIDYPKCDVEYINLTFITTRGKKVKVSLKHNDFNSKKFYKI